MKHSSLTLVIAACCVPFVPMTASNAIALPVQAGGGGDYYSGPDHQITRSALAFVGAGLGPMGSASLAGLRYDDTNIGLGNAYVAGIALPVAPMTLLRVWGTRFIGDESFRAWRVKTGPQMTLPGGPALGLYYTHFADDATARSDGATAELSVPLLANVNGRATASHATAPGALRSTQGSVGLSWNPFHALELSGEVGLARGGALSSGLAPSRGVLDQLLGGPPSSSSASKPPGTDPTALVGLRVTLP